MTRDEIRRWIFEEAAEELIGISSKRLDNGRDVVLVGIDFGGKTGIWGEVDRDCVQQARRARRALREAAVEWLQELWQKLEAAGGEK